VLLVQGLDALPERLPDRAAIVVTQLCGEVRRALHHLEDEAPDSVIQDLDAPLKSSLNAATAPMPCSSAYLRHTLS
jgi:hypothetical protein